MVLSYWQAIVKMPNKADKFELRLRLVQFATAHGVEPAARAFFTTAKTVRKWLTRYHQECLAGLYELPRIPLSCPHKTPPALERKIIGLRQQFPFMGARRLKFMHDLTPSHQAIGRTLKQHGLVHKRRKKHQRKQDFREVKKHWKLFAQFTVDTKQLKDIPHYWPQMKTLRLPRFQFTARDVRSGLMFLGFAHEDTAANACLFARLLCQHMHQCGLDLKAVRFQTDNGHEFIGCTRQDRSRDGFEKTVQSFHASHKRIPVRAWSYNSDVETVHSTIEDEFYDLENFADIPDFHCRVATYQAWYNLLRPNMNKDNRSPWQIIQQLQPKTDPALARLPPLMLDWLSPDYTTRDELSLRGYDVPWYPYSSGDFRFSAGPPDSAMPGRLPAAGQGGNTTTRQNSRNRRTIGAPRSADTLAPRSAPVKLLVAIMGNSLAAERADRVFRHRRDAIQGHAGPPLILVGRWQKHWSLTTLREKLVKIEAKVVSGARYVVFQMAEVAIPPKAVPGNPGADSSAVAAGGGAEMKHVAAENEGQAEGPRRQSVCMLPKGHFSSRRRAGSGPDDGQNPPVGSRNRPGERFQNHESKR